MSGQKIFIIEDDANLLYGLESQFSADGFVVETATGEEELEELFDQLKDFDPDYVILDVILPKVDGFEIIKRMKADNELSDKQIFIFTDVSDEDSRQRSLQLGADYFFFKEEFDTFEFAEKVKKIVANQAKSATADEERDYDE
ncbi:MAG: response regulator [Patescibacteria group bacterium]